mgnify:CR=1 FL=1
MKAHKSKAMIHTIKEPKNLSDQKFLSDFENLPSFPDNVQKKDNSSYKYVLTNLGTFVCFVGVFFIASLISDNNVKDYKK